MTEIRQILCPVDFSEFSRHAVDHAAAVARWYGARLAVLHVVPNWVAIDAPPVASGVGERARIMSDLACLTAMVPADIPLDLRVKEAPDVHEEVLGEAAALHADLMVLGSHGRSGFKRWLLGSVAEKLIRRSPCPVMVVPPHAGDVAPDAPIRFSHILCPVDFSDGSLLALEHALALAEEANSQLTLLHVIEVPPELREHPVLEDFNVDAVRAAAEAGALRRLRALIPDEARAYCTVETIVREGAAFREILKVAAERSADLVVMGLQGRGALDLMVFGSNTVRVARGVGCPVLMVRSTAHAKG